MSGRHSCMKWYALALTIVPLHAFRWTWCAARAAALVRSSAVSRAQGEVSSSR